MHAVHLSNHAAGQCHFRAYERVSRILGTLVPAGEANRHFVTVGLHDRALLDDFGHGAIPQLTREDGIVGRAIGFGDFALRVVLTGRPIDTGRTCCQPDQLIGPLVCARDESPYRRVPHGRK